MIWTLEEMELEEEKRIDDVQNYERGRLRKVSSKRMSNLMKRFEEGAAQPQFVFSLFSFLSGFFTFLPQ